MFPFSDACALGEKAEAGITEKQTADTGVCATVDTPREHTSGAHVPRQPLRKANKNIDIDIAVIKLVAIDLQPTLPRSHMRAAFAITGCGGMDFAEHFNSASVADCVWQENIRMILLVLTSILTISITKKGTKRE